MSTPIDPIRLAIPSKGHLYDGIIELLKTAGYKVRRASDRQYEATISGQPRFHVVFMRPTDIVIQVQEGRCHLGVTGMDVYAEHAFEAEQAVVVIPDLGYGGCRLVVAVPESWIDVGHIMDLVDLTTEFKAAGKTFRVSTKYPALVRQYFRKWGIYYYQLIDSRGRPRAAPEPGHRRHHRRPDQLGHDAQGQPPARDRGRHRARLGGLPDRPRPQPGHSGRRGRDRPAGPPARRDRRRAAIRGLAAPRGRGQPRRAAGPETAAAVASYLRDQGASHLVRGEVWDDQGQPGWRVTALVAASKLTACQRALFALGASRIVGLPAQFPPSSRSRVSWGPRRSASRRSARLGPKAARR